MARIDLELQELIDIAKNARQIWHNVSYRMFELDKVYLVSDGVKQWFGYFKDIGSEDEFELQCFSRDTDEVINATLYAEEPVLPND